MESAHFTKNDNGFVCANCGFVVEPLGTTSRNHCPRCLCSRHLDESPGDRACSCGGIMDPVSAEPDPRKGYVIVQKCRACGKVVRNKAALWSPRAKLPRDQYDDEDLLIRLTAKE